MTVSGPIFYLVAVAVTWLTFWAVIASSPRVSLAALPFDLLDRFERERLSPEVYLASSSPSNRSLSTVASAASSPPTGQPHPLLHSEFWPAIATGIRWVALTPLPREFFQSPAGIALLPTGAVVPSSSDSSSSAAGLAQVTILGGGCGCVVPSAFFERGGWRLFEGIECRVIPGLVAGVRHVRWLDVDPETSRRHCHRADESTRSDFDIHDVMTKISTARKIWAGLGGSI